MDDTVRRGRRPTGSPQWCARLLRSTLRDTYPLILDGFTAATDLLPGTPRTALREFVTAHPHAEFLGGVVLQSKTDSERSIRAVADLIWGIVALLESDNVSVVGSMVLARSAGESVLRFCHIYDPNVTPERTLIRMAAFQLESVEDNLRTAEAFGAHGEGDAQKAREDIATMHAYLVGNGFERLADRRRSEFTVNLTLDGTTENVRFNATEATGATWRLDTGIGL